MTGLPDDRARPPRRRTVAIVVGSVILVGIVVSSAWIRTSQPLFLLALPALVAVVAVAMLALTNFEWFLLGLLAVRASLDALKGGGVADITSLVGVGFIGAAAVWLLLQASRGRLIPSSWVTRGALAFVAAFTVVLPLSNQVGVSVRELARVVAAVAMLVVLEQVVRTRRQAIHTVVAVVVATIPVVVMGLVQIAGPGGNLVQRDGFSRVTGTFLHSNPLAMFLVMVGLLVVSLSLDFLKEWWVVAGAAAILPGFVFYSTYTRTAWIAFAVGVMVILGLRNTRLMQVALVAMVAGVLLVPGVTERFADLTTATDLSGNSANSLTWRAEFWGDSLRLVEGQEGTGIGLGIVREVTEEGKPPHNDVIRAYVEGGVMGLAGYLAFLVGMLAHAREAARLRGPGLRSALGAATVSVSVAFVLFAITSNLLSQVAVLWYVFAILALGSWAMRDPATDGLDVEPGADALGDPDGAQPDDAAPSDDAPDDAVGSGPAVVTSGDWTST